MPSATFTLEDFVRIETCTQPSYDANGGRVAFRSNRGGVSQAYLMPAGGDARQLTDTGGVIYHVEGRPGVDQLVVIADDGGDEQFQLHLVDLESGASRPLASMPHAIHNFGAWSPDGRLLSFASNRRDASVFDVYVLDVDSGDVRCVLEHDGMNAAGRFTVDQRGLLVSRPNLEAPGDNTLWLLDLAEDSAPRLLTPHEDQGLAEWQQAQPLEAAVLALANEDRDTFALQRIDLETGAREYLLERDWDLEALAVTPDGHSLAIVVNEDGASRLELYAVTEDDRLGARIEAPPLPEGIASFLDWRPDGRALAFTFEGPSHVSDVWSLDLEAGALVRLTASDTRGLPIDALPAPRLVRYQTFDGREIPAYYYLPDGAAERGPLPCIVLVHGGPEGQSRPALWGRYPAPHYLLARGDVALLVPNVRGSTGYGKEYSHADDVEKRMDSVQDLIAAADWLAATGEVDPDRIAVMGGSYGGFMVLAAITEAPDRWGAAIDLYGIADFETFLKFTGPWRRRHRAREYGDDPAFLRSISPIHKADRIRAPLLVFQGDRDVRVPPEESEQIVETVRRNEGIVEYVVYPEEGHGFQKLPHRLDLGDRVVAFIEAHLLPPPTEA